jgi:hypothetical protein
MVTNQAGQPPKATKDDMWEEPPMNQGGSGLVGFGKGGGSSLFKDIGIALVVSAVVVFIMSMMGWGSWLTKTEFNKLWGDVATKASLTTMQADVTARQGQVQTALDGIPAKVQALTAESNKSLTAQIIAMATKSELANYVSKSDINNYATKNELTNSTSGFVSKSNFDALQTTVNDMPNSATWSQTQTKITELETQLVELNKKVADLQATPIPTSTSSSTSNSTSTAVNGQVTASIISYSYISVLGSSNDAPTALRFEPAQHSSIDDTPTQPSANYTLCKFGSSSTGYWLNKMSSQHFQLQIQNNTGKTLNNIRINLMFVWVKSDGTQFDIPIGTTTTVTSLGNPQWTNVGNYPAYTAWITNTTSSSLLGNLWNFTQAPGTVSYYSSLTLNLPIVTTPATALILPSEEWFAIPIIKIEGYATS